MFRRVAPPWSESLLRPTATAASAGKSRGKAERRKEAGSPEEKIVQSKHSPKIGGRRSNTRDAIHEVQHISESGKVKRVFVIVVWLGVALLARSVGKIAFDRGEPLNATWFVVAAVCCYLVAYRLYSAFVAAKVLALDDTRATPCERRDDGRDFVPTNKWVLFGHHFAAIAGPGPLVGPTLAAQYGYLPGTLWLIAGRRLPVRAGFCHSLLFDSARRKIARQMAREEVSERGGFIAQLAVLAIMTILLAVVGLVVVIEPSSPAPMALSSPA